MRIGVIGLGFMGSTHLRAWQNVAGAQIAAVYSADEQKLTGDLSQVQGNLGGPTVTLDFSNVRKYRQIADILTDPDVDAVDLCLPTDLHASTAFAALRAGKHVLVEKPMALTGDDADNMIAEARKAGRILMAAQVLRFFPSYLALSNAIRSGGQFGTVRSALLRRRCAAPFWNKWLADASKSGGGVFDLLIHDVDFCLALFGMPEAVSATGYEDLDGGVDMIAATLHYRNVPSVVITGGWHHKKAYPFSMEYTVVTEGGTFEYSSHRGNDVILYDASGESHAVELPTEDGFEAELKYFVECCREGKRPDFCPPEESAQAVRLCLQLLEARRRNGEKIACRV
jgi:predicted dehydrogenase